MSLNPRKSNKSKSKKKLPEVYVVVCTELHNAVGPFLTLRDATKVAYSYTQQGHVGTTSQKCVFFPVPMQFLGEVVETPGGLNASSETHEVGGHVGQYL